MLPRSPLDIVKEELKSRGIRQAHLAKKLRISPQQLNNIFNKKQESSIYLPQMAEILGMSISSLKYGTNDSIRIIPIISSDDLLSLADKSVLFDELVNLVLNSSPFFINQDHYFFGYRIEHPFKSYMKDDLLVFNTYIPTHKISGRTGIAFISSTQSIFIGNLIYNEKDKIINIFNDEEMFSLKKGDFIFGVDFILQRQLGNIGE